MSCDGNTQKVAILIWQKDCRRDWAPVPAIPGDTPAVAGAAVSLVGRLTTCGLNNTQCGFRFATAALVHDKHCRPIPTVLV